LGIDEIALKKGHKDYVCVLVDLDTHEVVSVLEDRSKEFLKAYFEGLGKAFCEQIKVFCSDMWEGYIKLAEELFPNATIVVDRFHFYAHVQKGVDNCRKHFRRKFKDNEMLKGLKWPLLKNEQKLSDKEQEKLHQVFEQEEFQLLKITYEAKRAFRAILEDKNDQLKAEKRINKWIKQVEDLKIRHLFPFIKTLNNWKEYILNYFLDRHTTSLVEGINNKIKAIKRRAFGFLDFNNFKRKVLIDFLKEHP